MSRKTYSANYEVTFRGLLLSLPISWPDESCEYELRIANHPDGRLRDQVCPIAFVA